MTAMEILMRPGQNWEIRVLPAREIAKALESMYVKGMALGQNVMRFQSLMEPYARTAYSAPERNIVSQAYVQTESRSIVLITSPAPRTAAMKMQHHVIMYRTITYARIIRDASPGQSEAIIFFLSFLLFLPYSESSE